MNFDKIFHLKENHTDVKTEVMAGITTFMTMAYILAVNPNILSASGMDRGAVFTATALSSFIATCLMALLSNYPFVLAPGMGLNAYFTYTVVLGTTSCRTLESATDENGILQAGSGWTEIFIYPGYHFKMIDGLITNFHLPESTLLMLVSALAGKEHIMAAYEEAVKERYRFFSFGDAMLIL